MRCLVTCGPTYESLDKVRRLTNFSTGTLGVGLANSLVAARHQVTLLKGYYATCTESFEGPAVTFTTTDDLLARFEKAASERETYEAVFHAAAVSDFRFGTVYAKLPDGKLQPVTAGKFGSHQGSLLAELVPTPKVIARLRGLFPRAVLVGWKYEVDGSRSEAIEAGRRQLRENRTDLCVVNGPAYGEGFGVVDVSSPIQHWPSAATLYEGLLALVPTLARKGP